MSWASLGSSYISLHNPYIEELGQLWLCWIRLDLEDCARELVDFSLHSSVNTKRGQSAFHYAAREPKELQFN